MSPDRPSRRTLGRLLAGAAALLASRRGGSAQVPEDRGIGGTGAAEPPRDDRGVGGTGVVGTIRRFGSIVVNDLRIGFGPDVMVTVDGRRASPAVLRLGQVVRVVALTGPDGLATRRIDVASEVVGPVERRSAGRLVVLGQQVSVEGPAPWRVGETVAVSGLRRPDGVVAASWIERRAGALPRLSGTLRRHADGSLRIGSLVVRDADGTLAGERVTVEGRRLGGALRVASLVPESSVLRSLGTERLSLEAWVARVDEGLATGAGLGLDPAGAGGDLPRGAVVRAVVSATMRPDGQVVVDRVQAMDREGRLTGRATAPGPAPGAVRGGREPAGPSGGRGPGPAGAPHGPGSKGPGGGPGGGGR